MNQAGATRWIVRTVLPAGILLGGLGAASLFRVPGPPPAAGTPAQSEPVVYRQPEQPPGAGAFIPEPRPRRIEPSPPGPSAFAASAAPATVLATAETDEPPPTLGRAFPQNPPSSRWGISMGIGLPGAGPSQTRTHKIADGDTLPSLAQLYLGDAGRYLEIFQANRDVLPSPEALPIGRELKIPPRRATVPERPDPTQSAGSAP